MADIAVIDVIVPASPVVDVRSLGVQGPPGEDGAPGPPGPAGPQGPAGTAGIHAATHAAGGADAITGSLALTGGTLSIGATPAQSGALRLGNDQNIVGRVAANNDDIPMIRVGTNDQIIVGIGHPVHVPGPLNCTNVVTLQNRIDVPGYFSFAERAAPTVPAVNGANIWLQDNGSNKSQLMIQFSTGAPIVIATQL